MSKSGHAGAFRTTEEAFKNFIEEVNEINPYWGAISDALFVTEGISVDAPLSEVYKYVANKKIEAMEKKLREFDPNGKSEAWEELKRLDGIKEFFKKVYEIAYRKLTENKPLMNMLWDSTNLDAFVIYFLANDVLGGRGNFKYLNTSNDCCAWSMTEHIGSIIHSLEKKYGINLSDEFEPIMKWNITEIYDRDVVDKKHVTQKEVRKDKTLEKVEGPARGLNKYVRIAIAALSAPPITGVIYEVAPKIVDTVGNYLVQLGLWNNPHVAGMGAFTAATGAIVYGLTKILFRGAAEEIEEIEYKKRAEKTEIVTKTGETYSSFNEWARKRLPKIIEENKTEIYESIRDWMLNYAIPQAKKRVEEVYRQVKEAEEKGYIPLTAKEIWENYDYLTEKDKEFTDLYKDKNGNIIRDYSIAKLSFATSGDFDRLRMGVY